jgi:UDP-N-acetylglucosamine 2-epimerase (non-hydrolysing)
MRVAHVVGTRPQLIKAAALQPALHARHDEVFIDTGQHWDDAMAGAFFAELGLRAPDLSLGIGGGSATEQTGRMLIALEGAFLESGPEAVIAYGDTNSTLAAALAAAKLSLPVAHVEAGLRSFDRQMPEEINRVVTDHLAQWNFAPTAAAVANLAAEGLTSGVHLVGDVMRDLAARTLEAVRDERALAGIAGGGLRSGQFMFATIHRAENRRPEAIRSWVALLDTVARRDRPVVLALHPGTRAAMVAIGGTPGPDVTIVEPLAYRSSLAAQLHAAAVLTDSGGVQREASWLGTPCLVLRGTTEWLETVDGEGASSVLVGLDADRARETLDRLAPVDAARSAATTRARERTIDTDGATESIARLLG